jgi:hypothetical protein
LTSTPTPPPSSDCFGDVNGDGRVSGRDVAAVIRAMIRGYNPAADLNHDGKVNFKDLKLVIIALIRHEC